MAYILSPGRPRSKTWSPWSPDEPLMNQVSTDPNQNPKVKPHFAGCHRAHTPLAACAQWNQLRKAVLQPSEESTWDVGFQGDTINIHQLIWDFMTGLF